jgi:hypothetical protein
LALLNGRLPKKPLLAESGEGCAALSTVCRVGSISASFLAA